MRKKEYKVTYTPLLNETTITNYHQRHYSQKRSIIASITCHIINWTSQVFIE